MLSAEVDERDGAQAAPPGATLLAKPRLYGWDGSLLAVAGSICRPGQPPAATEAAGAQVSGNRQPDGFARHWLY